MGAIYNLLEQHRLQDYYARFHEMGVNDERDFLDVTDENLNDLRLSQVEHNRFSALLEHVRRMRAPGRPASASVNKSLASFCLKYTHPKCPELKHINDMDPAQNTVEDLMVRIGHMEGVGRAEHVCLFTVDGMPLTDDPFFNTWSLKDRHIADGDVIYVMVTPKENLTAAHPTRPHACPETNGTETVRCHVMLRGNFEVDVDLENDTISVLKNRLAEKSGIPGRVLHYRGSHGAGTKLQVCGISDGSTVNFSLSSFSEEFLENNEFCIDDIKPSVRQTPKGISSFLSMLYIIKSKGVVDVLALIGYIRKLTGCSPLAQSLYQLLWKNEMTSRNQKVAVVEGLYFLFRELLPKLGTQHGDKIIEDPEVFEYSPYCWAYLMSQAKDETTEHENYAPLSLVSEDGRRFCDPVKVPGVPGVYERADIVKKIRDGEKIPNCSEENLRETSLNRDTCIEKLLLSIHPSAKTYHLWISHGSVTGQNFHVDHGKSFGDLAKAMEAFPQLKVTPPLLLKDLCDDFRLVYLNKNNLGVYLTKNKLAPANIEVFDCMAGKRKTIDVDQLAASTGDSRDDNSLHTTRTPKEAIMVLIDTSSSMSENCYGSVEMQKIHAVKELFDNFANRTMAYDFHHIIGLMTFDTTVKMVHTFTETLEKFKEQVRTLEASGTTKLFDALQLGVLELVKLKSNFPDCKLRILCLTDGNDVGSLNTPEVVTANLIKSNIIMDSILLGKVENVILRGISEATGGCCFKPETSTDGLKLFETETVLSLKSRKLKTKANASLITKASLAAISASCGYDAFPEVILPSQMNTKVTMTQSALKKKIQESKLRTLMEREKRIMAELRSLHCNPHPYFSIFPSETDFAFWKIVMEGPPGSPYENGAFELFCQFGPNYPVKPPLVRFVTPVYHCNINNIGRICHNIFDRNYNANVTMKDILNAICGLLIIPEPEDPLDSILAEEFLTSPQKYEQEAKKHTEETAAKSRDELEKELVDCGKQTVPQHLICPLTHEMFVDPVVTNYGRVYERKAIEKHLQTVKQDPVAGAAEPLTEGDLTPANEMKKMVTDQRVKQIQ